MTLTPVRITRVQGANPISDPQGRATAAFLQTINTVIGQIEGAINGVIAAQNAADAAQAAANAASAAAAAAASQADAAQTTANGANAAAAAAQTTADGKIDETSADARYVRQSITPVWTTPTGTLNRATFVSYVDPGASSTYSQTQIDALMTAVQTVSQTAAALVTDLRAIKALT